MKKIETATDSDGMLRNFPVHDGSWYSFEYDFQARVLILNVKSSSDRLCRMVAKKVEEANIQSLYEGNIVSEVFYWNVGEVPEPKENMPDIGWSALSKHGSTISEAIEKMHAVKMDFPEHKLLQITASYGCSISLICASIELFVEI